MKASSLRNIDQIRRWKRGEGDENQVSGDTKEDEDGIAYVLNSIAQRTNVMTALGTPSSPFTINPSIQYPPNLVSCLLLFRDIFFQCPKVFERYLVQSQMWRRGV
jgi:hypothetical protein